MMKNGSLAVCAWIFIHHYVRIILPFLIIIIIIYLIFVLFYNTAPEKQELLVLYNRPLSAVKWNSHSVTDNLQFNT